MKRIILVMMSVVALLPSCKKNGAPAPKEKLLSSIYENDKLRVTFEYTPGKKLKKIKKYVDGAVAAIQEDTYEYDGNGYLKERINVLYSTPKKFVYECNNTGLVTKITVIDLTGVDSGTVEQWMSYSYNAQNQLIKINYYLGDDTPEGYESLEYGPNDGLVAVKAYVEKPGGSELAIIWKYTGSSNRINPGLFKTFIEPDKKEFMYLNAKSIDITLYSAGGLAQSNVNHTMSDREAGGPGLYAKQTITSKQTFPLAGVPQKKQMRYEYVEM